MHRQCYHKYIQSTLSVTQPISNFESFTIRLAIISLGILKLILYGRRWKSCGSPVTHHIITHLSVIKYCFIYVLSNDLLTNINMPDSGILWTFADCLSSLFCRVVCVCALVNTSQQGHLFEYTPTNRGLTPVGNVPGLNWVPSWVHIQEGVCVCVCVFSAIILYVRCTCIYSVVHRIRNKPRNFCQLSLLHCKNDFIAN